MVREILSHIAKIWHENLTLNHINALSWWIFLLPPCHIMFIGL
uniref:Uncharacterized protein n=1 Tax=Rhizophora mucronata TaxID=61149 RepID=A0A2P2P4H4_RHIMU